MVNSELRTAWIAALRSGEYPQGREQLKDWQGRFCCLGVLVDVAAKRDQIPGSWVNEAFVIDSFSHSESYFEFPPKYLTRHVGLTEKQEVRLAELNDGGDLSFSQIADLLESDEWPA